MSLIDVDTWVTEQESIDRLHSSILADIVTRNNLKKNSEEYSKLSANIRIRINQFERELVDLKLKLDSSLRDRTITIEEGEKRRNHIRAIESDHKRLLESYRNYSYATDSSSQAKSVWQSEDDDELMTSASAAQRKPTTAIIEEQNRGLETLTESILRQKNLSTAFQQEIVEQNEILDDLADNIIRFDGRVNNSTRQIGVINTKDSTWGYWLAIILLFIVICIVAVI